MSLGKALIGSSPRDAVQACGVICFSSNALPIVYSEEACILKRGRCMLHATN
jgi:hypothetical protein